MDKKGIGEIRELLKVWNEGHTDNEILCRANGIILRVPELLASLENAQKENEQLRETLRRLLYLSQVQVGEKINYFGDAKIFIYECPFCKATYEVGQEYHEAHCPFFGIEM